MCADHTLQDLSPREREVALLLADGLSPLLIARRLAIEPGTVKTYIQRLRARLHLASQQDIIAWVAARGDPGQPGGSRRAAHGSGGTTT